MDFISFRSGIEGQNEIVSSYMEQNAGELEPGKTYKYVKSQKRFEEIDTDSVK